MRTMGLSNYKRGFKVKERQLISLGLPVELVTSHNMGATSLISTISIVG
jgi:hypothetical protein